MDNLFVWIVMFAGAVIALLGIFLVASEKELKVKRRENEELLTRLESGPQENSPSELVTPQPDNSAELAELRARNQDLQNQLNTLSSKLELGRRTIEELEATQGSTDAEHAAAQELRASNDQLKTEVNELRNLLQASETQITGSAAGPDAAEHTRMQSEIMDLTHELKESHAKIRQLEGLHQKIANVDALEERHGEERQRLQSRIAELERELSIGQENIRGLETLRDRLTESERIQESLLKENRRHEEEIARCRERIAEGEDNRTRLASLQAPYDELISKHTALAERQHEFQAELTAFARRITMPVREIPPMSSSPHSPSHGSEHSTDARDERPSSAGEPAAASREQKSTRRFGIFSAVVVLAAAALLAVQYFSSNAGESTAPVIIASAPRVTEPSAQPVKPLSRATRQPTAMESATVPKAPIAKATAKAAVNENSESSKSTKLAKQEARAADTYEITQPSRVYAAPSELSQLIGKIEPGVKVNVVNTRDGWLEIHSKYGRPPGFIRREVAARVSGRN
jgi:hypothetical protein